MPTLSQRAERLARDNVMTVPPGADPYETFDRFLAEQVGTRADLDAFLKAQFRPQGADPAPGALHAHLAELAEAGAFPAVIDTNYDLLLRRAMEAIRASFTPAVLERTSPCPTRSVATSRCTAAATTGSRSSSRRRAS